MKSHHIQEIAMVALQIFATLSAIAGGVALMVGAIELPAEWLDGSPFSSYTIPGAILALIVGGSQFVALWATSRQTEWQSSAAAIAGITLMGWIAGELITVGSNDFVMLSYQLFYFAIGFAELVLAALQLGEREYAE